MLINIMSNLEPLLNPKSVAIVGASSNPEKVGFQILKNLQDGGFAGVIYPINLKKEIILGLQSRTSVIDVAGSIDLAVIAIPASAVREAVLACVKKKVRSIIIISAGFAETGPEGKKLQDEIAAICNNADIALLGPNCFGVVNTRAKVNTTFAKNMPTPGPVSFLSQSGAIISSVIDWSKTANLGFSKILSIGNKALLSESSILEYLYEDSQTKVILAYLESLTINDSLSSVLINYARTKPTIFIFGGKSDFGVTAARSHTGSIVSPYLSIKTYLKQAGVITVDTLEEFLVLARSFAKYDHINGKRIAVITNAGGPGILVSDALSFHGLELARFSDETDRQLRAVFRPEANLHNPLDILGDASAEDYARAIEIVSNDPEVDGMAAMLTPQTATKINETADIITNYRGEKPLTAAFIGGEFLVEAKEKMRQQHVPCFDFPEEAVEALSALYQFSVDEPELILGDKTGTQPYDPNKKVEILRDWDFPILEYEEAGNWQDLLAIVSKKGYPVVLKTADPTIIHKSDALGVKLDIRTEADLKKAFDELGGQALVGKMVQSRIEIFLGAKRQSHVGEVIAFGTGGIYAELYSDFSYRIAPVTHEVALKMIEETKIGQVLSGMRKQKPCNLNLLAEIIVKVSWLMKDFKNITEIDFNPILAEGDFYYIVDTRIICE